MKCVKFLVSAVAVNALTADDDDMNVMELRALSSNATNTTTTTGGGGGTAGGATTTTNNTNTTAGKTAGGGTTDGKTAGGGTTNATDGRTAGKVAADTPAPPAGLKTHNITNSTDTTIVEVTTEAKFSAPNPFDAALQAASASSGRRRLASHVTATTSLMKAYDLYCGALGLTTSKVVCDSFTDAEKLDLFGDTTGNNCIISLKHPTGADMCSKTSSSDSGDGACFYNGVAKDAAWGSGIATHTVCTRDNGAGASTYEYNSKSTIEMPAFIASTVDTAAMVTAAAAEMTSADTATFLSKAVIVAVAAIAANPVTAAAVESNFGNFTAAFGVDKTTLTTLDSTLYSSGAFTVAEMDTAVTSNLVADLGQVVDLTALSSESTTDPGSSGSSSESTAASLFAGSSMALALVALLM